MVFKAVIFDVGGVLVSPPQAAIRSYEKVLDVAPGSLRRVFARGQPENAFCKLERGEYTLSQFIPEFDKECCRCSDDNDFSRGFSANELFSCITSQSVPNFTMLAIAKILKDMGYKTCALTNNWLDGTSDLSSMLSSHFDCVIESCKVGIRKPDCAIYKVACKKLDVQPSEVVFLDDLGVNLKSASKLGMATIKVQSLKSAVEQLERTLQIKLTLNSRL